MQYGMDGTGVLNECDAEEWLLTNKVMETTQNPQFYKYLQYGLFDEDKLLGLIQIRLELKGYLIEYGGHIGYCVRPSERRKGYAYEAVSNLVKLLLDDLKLDMLIAGCFEDNIASKKCLKNYSSHLKEENAKLYGML